MPDVQQSDSHSERQCSIGKRNQQSEESMGSTPGASLPSGAEGDDGNVLGPLPDDSWREGLADPQTWAQNGLSNADALLMTKLRHLQTLIHTCDVPVCKAKFATADQLAVHQETTHTQWPSGTDRQQPSFQEDRQALRSALMNVEREFSVMLQELISNLHRGTDNLTALAQKLNELQDVHAARQLPTAAMLCNGAVRYASFVSAESTGGDAEKLRDLLRLAVVNLQHAQGLGGELEVAFRSLRFRSALMDEGELREMADSEPRDVFCAAAGAILKRVAPEHQVYDPPGILGEPMQLLLSAALSLDNDQGNAVEITARLPETWAKLPWSQKLIQIVKDARI
jgi:hypothetical protein